MDDKTRMYYRRKISELSLKNHIEEYKIAEILVELSREGEGKSSHVGYYMFEKPLGKSAKKSRGGAYIGVIILSALFISLLIGFILDSVAITLLLFLPISEIVKNVADFFVIKLTQPRLIPKLELKEGIPEEGKTLCVISVLLTSDEACAEYPRLLEEYFLANRDSGEMMLFGILADLPEAKAERCDTDGKRIAILKTEIEKLNKQYGRFYLFTRERVLSKSNSRYMGWERKRGAIIELVCLLS
jgi:cyclic beta-1,2-glucan synthetase